MILVFFQKMIYCSLYDKVLSRRSFVSFQNYEIPFGDRVSQVNS